MTADSIMQEIRQALEGRPGQPLVLGVCQVLAEKMDSAAWLVRLATLVLALFFTLPVLAAYIILGFALKQTESRTRDFFAGLFIMARETADKVLAALGRIFGNAGERPGTNGY